jgi:hypothetical protein
VLKDIDIEFCNAGGVLFGVKDYVPALRKLHREVRAHLTSCTTSPPSTARRKRPGSR